MVHFTSSREKKLWGYAFLVLLAIYSSLFWGRPLAIFLFDNNMAAVFFLLGMLLVGITIIVHGFRVKRSKTELVIWIGLTAVIIMFLLRLGLAERSHVIEYGVLAIFIHKAMIERFINTKYIFQPAIIALVISFILGVIDECLQLFIPDRVFDPTDILFNGLAVFMAIGSSLLLFWIRRKKNPNI